MNPKLLGQIRHFLTSGGWMVFVFVFLLLFMPQGWWDNAQANAQKLKSIVALLGMGSGGIALLGHYLSLKDKEGREGEASRDSTNSDFRSMPIGEALQRSNEQEVLKNINQTLIDSKQNETSKNS
jgi:hypothetical protein